jgi:hypothetical protein
MNKMLIPQMLSTDAGIAAVTMALHRLRVM